jgi:SAM-dependent methyltransferase
VKDASRAYYGDYWKDGLNAWSARGLGVRAAEVRLLERAAVKGGRALDIGCGDGRAGKLLQCLGMDYTGLDVSDSAVELCLREKLHALRHDMAEPLPFEDCCFDLVTVFEVLEHLFLPHAAFGEIVRVLKPGGVVVGSVPNVCYLPNRLLMLAGRFNPGGSPATSLKEPWRDPHIRFFSSRSMKRFLQSGFPVTVDHIGGAPLDLAEFPVLYRSPCGVQRCLEGANRLVGFLGVWLPAVFSSRVYFAARKAAPG